MKDLIIYGTGLIGEVSEFFFRKDSDYRVAVFTNAGEFIREDSFCGKPVVPFEELKTSHPPPAYEVFIALGYAKTNRIRQARYLEAKEKGVNFWGRWLARLGSFFDRRYGPEWQDKDRSFWDRFPVYMGPP